MPPPPDEIAATPPTSEGDAATTGRQRPATSILAPGFSLAGVLFILYASQSSPVLLIPFPGQFGLFEALPFAYWIGMALIGLALALALRSGSDMLFVLTGALFLAIFAATPALFEQNPSIADAYGHFAFAQAIYRSGRLPTDPTAYAFNWPGFYLVMAFVNAMGGLPPVLILALFTFFSGAMTFIAVFVFARSFFPAGVARLASVLAALLNVWAQFHVSPQGVGLTLALLVLATAWERRVPLRVANVVLFVGLTVTHATSAIFLLAFFGADAVLALLAPRRRPSGPVHESMFAGRFNPFLTYGGVWLGWLFFVATGSAFTAKTAVVTRIGSVLRIGAETSSIVSTRTAGNIYNLPPLLRLGALGIFGLASLVGILILFRNRGTRGQARFLLAAFLGLGILAFSDIQFFGGQFYDRALMFAAILAPGVCLAGLQVWNPHPAIRRTVIVVLLVAGLVAASTFYYEEALYVEPTQGLALSQFFATHGDQVRVLDGFLPEPVWLLNNQDNPWTENNFFSISPTPLRHYAGPPPSFAVYDGTAQLWYQQYYGMDMYQVYQGQQANYSLVYDNGYGQAYLL